ncbi:MAG: ABC-2 family transporter protein [Spirochaetales bacterium]|nr:ABC-2 family transporter protein [Spirochaetales bacterium]
MMKKLKIYGIAFKNALATRLAYRVDFIISAFVMLLFELTIPFFTFMIYQNGAGFPGWSFNEVLLIQAGFLLCKGITFPFFAGIVWNTIEHIRNGTFDLLLIRPLNPLFMVMLTGIDIKDLGKLIGGIALFTIAVSSVPGSSAINWIFFAFLMICSILVFMSFAFLMAASGFKWVGNFRVYDIFESLTAFAMYPRSIFSKALQFLITAIIPLALMGFLPASVLLNRPPADIWISLLSCLIFLVFSIFFWYRMMKNYSSAGG